MTGIRIIISREMFESIKEVISYFKEEYGIDISSSDASKIIADRIKKDGRLEVIITKDKSSKKNKSFFDIKTR